MKMTPTMEKGDLIQLDDGKTGRVMDCQNQYIIVRVSGLDFDKQMNRELLMWSDAIKMWVYK